MTRTCLAVALALGLGAAFLVVDVAPVFPAAEVPKIGTVVAPPMPPPQPPGKPIPLPLIVYADGARSPYNPTGWMGNNKFYTFKTDSTENPHSGRTCIKIEFTESTDFGGVAWMDPPNDWGDKVGGYNLTGAKTLAFWARGAAGGEKVTFGYGLVGAEKKFHDTAEGKLVALELTKDWKLYTISLADKDLTCIKSAFYWMYKLSDNKGKGGTFYIDDIGYTPQVLEAKDAKPKATAFPLLVYGPGMDAKPPYVPSGRVGAGASAAMNLKSTDNPLEGSKTCIKCDFTGRTARGGAVWQDPANDMGDLPGGHNLTGAGSLIFWARGAVGGETVTFGYGLIGPDRKYPDSSSGALKDVELTKEWKEYAIPLAGKDLSCIKTGFYWISDAVEKPKTFYLDFISYEAAKADPPAPVAGPPAAADARGKEAKLPLVLCGDTGGAWPYQPTGWMDAQKQITLNMRSDENPHAGKTCARVDFAGNSGMVGVLWQDPANDWGAEAGGYDLSAAKALTFWARGAAGAEKITFGVGFLTGKKYSDSALVKIEVTLSAEWKQYTIPLAGKDLSRIKTGFYWQIPKADKPVTFFLDDIQFE
jgi:hypothetical protein